MSVGEIVSGSEAGTPRRRGIPPALGCLASVALGALCVGVFYLVLSLGLQGELRAPRGELGELRLWLIREPGYRGLGRSWTRVVQGSERSGNVCLVTSIRFMMTEAEEPIEDLDYCECYQKEGERWHSLGECPEPGP